MPKLMLKITHSWISKHSAAALILLTLSSSAWAEGSTVFASVTNSDQEFELKAQIGVDFGVDVRAVKVWVNQVEYIRLQSSIMPEGDARALVSRAISKGYDAWYDSSGNKWADTREKSGGGASSRSTYRVASAVQTSSTDIRPLEIAPLNATVTTAPAEYAPAQSSVVDREVVQPTSEDLSHLPVAETFPIE